MKIQKPKDLVYDAAGLLPVIVQDRASGDVLMLAWANTLAVVETASTGLAHFWSRSRGKLWKKGGTSGNTLEVREMRTDCDHDALLYVVEPDGPACHTGMRSCFGETSPTAAGILEEVRRVIARRHEDRPERSYTRTLLEKGPDHVLRKVGEEAIEVILAAKSEGNERLAEEVADLLFHLLVVLAQHEVPNAAVMDVMRARRQRR